MKTYLAILLLFSLCACATTTGVKIDDATIDSIKDGKDSLTRDDVRGKIGAPPTSTQDTADRQCDVYGYSKKPVGALSKIFVTPQKQGYIFCYNSKTLKLKEVSGQQTD